MQRHAINPWQWQDRFGFSQAVEVTGGQRVLYCAGQAAADAEGNAVHPGDIDAQIRQSLDNLELVLTRAGYGLSDVVRLTVYTTDVDRVLASWDTLVGPLGQAGVRPAMALLGVTRLAFPDMMVEIEATAVK
jgi:enamine deaminase RidA (YjgF/YER057c/UK114 family)